MLNLLTKTKPWMVASLIVATSVFGQDSCNPCPKPCPPKCEKPCPAPCPKPCAPCPAPECKPKCCPTPCPQPCPPTQLCPPPCPNPCCPPWPVPVLNAAYNYPAVVRTRCPWDVYFDASFIYWQPIQENMELGLANFTVPAAGPGTPVVSFVTPGINGSMIGMDFNYKPGFKVGFGWNSDYDNWDLQAEYTWFHSKQHHFSNGPAVGQIHPTWGSSAFLGANVYGTAHEDWRLRMDLIDVDLGRWYYVGTKLIFRPNFGGRAAFIRQKVTVEYTSGPASLGIGTIDNQTVKARSTSWAVGAKTGLDTHWMLGSGFRLFGNGEADLMFTRYNRLSFHETHTAVATSTVSSAPFKVKQKRYNCLRTHLDLELGLGWGTYWDCNNWYTDVALGYEFQVFFDQNMFRHFNSVTMFGNSFSPNGNLYVHGLTATFMLSF